MRENRSIERRIRNARFPVLKSLHDFQWSWPKKINRPQIQNLFRLAFIATQTNIVLIGNGEIQANLAGGIGGLHKAGTGVVRVTRIITRLSPWSRTTIRSGWRSRAGFVNRRRYYGPYIAAAGLQDLNPQRGSRGPKMLGTASQAVDA
jgi:hypothetical protein